MDISAHFPRTGKIYSIVAYLWTFIASTDYLPELMECQTFHKLRQIICRCDKRPEVGNYGIDLSCTGEMSRDIHLIQKEKYGLTGRFRVMKLNIKLLLN